MTLRHKALYVENHGMYHATVMLDSQPETITIVDLDELLRANHGDIPAVVTGLRNLRKVPSKKVLGWLKKKALRHRIVVDFLQSIHYTQHIL